MKSYVIFNQNNHKCIVIGRDADKPDEIIDTNQVIISHNGQSVLVDPGGSEIFPQVLTELSKNIETEHIKSIVSSHQDPDVSSSLALWLELKPDIKVYCSWLWTGFLAHFGMGTKLVLTPVPDEGMALQIGSTNSTLYLVPAHYAHSPGNFSVYDPISDIVFSGDIGAALLPNSESDLYVKDFNQHIGYMEAFHKRWMPNRQALKAWVKRIRAINPAMICPQHGSIFTGENVGKFLNWLDEINCADFSFGDDGISNNSAVWLKWKKR